MEIRLDCEETMKKETVGRLAKLAGMLKAPKLTYILRHPMKGPRNLLALRGAKSLLKTKGAAITTAAVAATAVAAPLTLKIFRKGKKG